MTPARKTSKRVVFVALASVVVLGSYRGSAADQTKRLPPPPTAESASKPTPTAQRGAAPGDFLQSGQLVPNYQCAPEADCALRACPVGPSGQYWFRADYLLWWTRGVRVIPLVTTSDADDGGIIGNPTTEILFGDQWVGGDDRSGVRINFGHWFHCGRTAGIEFDFLTLGQEGTDFRYTSTDQGEPLYARPFYDVNPEVEHENAELVSSSDPSTGPAWLRGTVSGRIDEYFHSAGANFRLNLCCHEPCGGCCGDACCLEESCGGSCGESGYGGSWCSEIAATRAAMYCRGLRSMFGPLGTTCYRVDLIAGYRSYQLNDTLRVVEDLRTIGPDPHGVIAIGTTVDLFDDFRTRNEFHGGELGLIAQVYQGRWSLELLAKAALGNNSQVVTIDGQTTFQAPGDEPATYDGGLLALDTNRGRYTHNEFVVIPQFEAEIGYQLTCRTRAYFGYSLIYWASVARAAEQVDYTVNSQYFPPVDEPEGPARPRFVWHDSNFWAQGMNFGLEYRF